MTTITLELPDDVAERPGKKACSPRKACANCSKRLLASPLSLDALRAIIREARLI